MIRLLFSFYLMRVLTVWFFVFYIYLLKCFSSECVYVVPINNNLRNRILKIVDVTKNLFLLSFKIWGVSSNVLDPLFKSCLCLYPVYQVASGLDSNCFLPRSTAFMDIFQFMEQTSLH